MVNLNLTVLHPLTIPVPLNLIDDDAVGGDTKLGKPDKTGKLAHRDVRLVPGKGNQVSGPVWKAMLADKRVQRRVGDGHIVATKVPEPADDKPASRKSKGSK